MATTYASLMLEFKDRPIAGLRDLLDRTDQTTSLREFMSLLRKGMISRERMYVRTVLASAVASQTITAVAASVAVDDTVVIGGTTLTVKTSPANENQITDAATNALLAASVVSCINAHSTLSKYVWAAATTAASGIVTVYAKYPGPIGNFITLTKTGGFAVGGATFASGASDECDEFNLGYSVAGAVAG